MCARPYSAGVTAAVCNLVLEVHCVFIHGQELLWTRRTSLIRAAAAALLLAGRAWQTLLATSKDVSCCSPHPRMSFNSRHQGSRVRAALHNAATNIPLALLGGAFVVLGGYRHLTPDMYCLACAPYLLFTCLELAGVYLLAGGSSRTTTSTQVAA